MREIEVQLNGSLILYIATIKKDAASVLIKLAKSIKILTADQTQPQTSHLTPRQEILRNTHIPRAQELSDALTQDCHRSRTRDAII